MTWCRKIYDEPPAWQPAQWERLRGELMRHANVVDESMGELALTLRRPWFERWRNEPLRSFAKCSYQELAERPGFGRLEFKRLLGIALAARRRQAEDGRQADAQASQDVAEAALRRLVEWKIPADLPIELLPLPAALSRYAQWYGCATVGDWIRLLGMEQGTTRYIRPSGIAAARQLNDALAGGDADRVRDWLPLAENRCGLSFAAGMQRLCGGLPPPPRQIIELRLLSGKTYREVAGAHGCSVERAEQTVRGFLKAVQQHLDYFFPDQTRRQAVADGLTGFSKADLTLIMTAVARVSKRPIKLSPSPPVADPGEPPAGLRFPTV